MKIYNYHPDTKFYLGESTADPDPVVHAAITERERRLSEHRANQRARLDAEARGDDLVLPYPTAEDPDEIAPQEPSYLFPAFSTTVAPPANIPEGKCAVWLDTAWAIVDLPEPEGQDQHGTLPNDFFPEDHQPQNVEAAHKAWAARTLQNELDIVAKAHGYDDIRSAVSYAEEPAVPQFQKEGRAMRRWRSLFWKAAYEKLAAVQAGLAPPPTTREALLEDLPPYQPPPEA